MNAALLVLALVVPAADDILLADFEGASYGDWKVEGDAFGPGPARGTLPGQMPVSGYLGERLVNSFFQGDGTTGTLTSPPFTIERPFINFLVGGGGHEGQTCVNLLVEGKVVRSTTGANQQPGGSEALDWSTWDVREFQGREGVIQVVDRHTGGWGHINVDQILQSDTRRATAPVEHRLTADRKYLWLPVRTGAPKRVLQVLVDGRLQREMEIELADREADTDGTFRVALDISPFRGRELTLRTNLPQDSKALAAAKTDDQFPGGPGLYTEKWRPQFHFTSRRGWLNDPNGLVYFDGEYHLFYQHNPYGANWGNMHWGHAVSPDLVHWRELGIALYPRQFGDWAFSGSAVVDETNTSGFGEAGRPPLVLAYTSTGRGECIAYSLDRGRTWQEHPQNPVVKHRGRDPRLLWYAPGKHWVMAVYDEQGDGEEQRNIAFYTSPNLKEWTYRSRVFGYFECPDLVELPIQPAGSPQMWVLYGADGKYTLGEFDGQTFQPRSPKQQLWYGNFYAAQTFTNVPGGRQIQIGWASGVTFPSMPFNQQMTLPAELTLRATPAGPRLHAEPVKELLALRGRAVEQKLKVPAGELQVPGVTADLLEIVADFATEPERKAGFGLRVKGLEIRYEPAHGRLVVGNHQVPLPLENERLSLQIFVDRGSVEVFANRGAAAVSQHHLASADVPSLVLFTDEQPLDADLRVYELRSAWEER